MAKICFPIGLGAGFQKFIALVMVCNPHSRRLKPQNRFRLVELTDDELERLKAVMYMRRFAWAASATAVSWSTAVSPATRWGLR